MAACVFEPSCQTGLPVSDHARSREVANPPPNTYNSHHMHLKVNGDDREMPDGSTVRQLVAEFKLTPEKVAVERNRRLVRGDGYDAPLAEGDEVEIVTFVGGG